MPVIKFRAMLSPHKPEFRFRPVAQAFLKTSPSDWMTIVATENWIYPLPPGEIILSPEQPLKGAPPEARFTASINTS
jgi:hypothetical protein